MILGTWSHAKRMLAIFALVLAGMGLAPAALAQDVIAAPQGVTVDDTLAADTATDTAADAATTDAAPAPAGSYTPMKPTPGKGMPVDGRIGFQDQYSPIGEYALWMHNVILMPIIVVISLFVLGLLLWVVSKYRAKANPVPSKTSHNTTIEVIWTLLPVLILLGIAIPSIDLLAKQYKTAPADALTIKVTGYQWYWGYSYPDMGDFEVISNMMPEADALASGEPPQLAVDNRMVVPVGVPIRIQTTGADVIHSFAVPSLWFKLDAVPGRINEKMLTVNEPGVYYGQCMELCGIRHGYMPIAVEALPQAQFDQWVLAQGGTLQSTAPAGGNQPGNAEIEQPESAIPGAAGAESPAPEGAAGTPAPTV